jgi:hypothetical protein
VGRITNGSAERVQGEKRPAGRQQADFQKSSDGTYSYTTRAVVGNPKTGGYKLASFGIVVSESSVMMWLKT